MAITKVNNDLQDALAASQPTITSTGTLTGLTVSGEITANGGIALGDGDELTLGDSDEFKIKHHASGYTHLQNTVGTLYIDSDSVIFRDDAGSPSNMVIDSSGRVTMPSQPAFQVRQNAIQTNIAINTAVTVTWQTEIFDQGANFASNTFTAPVTGKYQLNAHLLLDNVDSASSYYQLILNTSNRLYYDTMDPGISAADYSYQTINHSVLADMDAGDTAIVTIVQGTGTAQSDINGTTSVFSGYLVA